MSAILRLTIMDFGVSVREVNLPLRLVGPLFTSVQAAECPERLLKLCEPGIYPTKPIRAVILLREVAGFHWLLKHVQA